jgi:hypothetical protein
MSAEAGTLERLVRLVGEALAVLADRLDLESAADLIADLGLSPPWTILESTGVGAALSAAAATADELKAGLPGLIAAIEAADASSPATIATLVDQGRLTLEHIAALIAKIEEFPGALRTGALFLPPDEQGILEQFLGDFVSRLIDKLLLEQIDKLNDRAVSLIALTGILEDRIVGDPAGDPRLIPHRYRRTHLDALGKLAKNPTAYLADTTGWGRSDFDGHDIIARIINVLDIHDHSLRLLFPPGEPVRLDIPYGHLTIGDDPANPTGPKGLVARWLGEAIRDVEFTIPLGSPWSLLASSKSRWEAGVELGLFPPGRLTLKPAAGEARADLALTLNAEREDKAPMTLIALAGATRIETKRFEATLGLKLAAAVPPGQSHAEPSFSFTPEGLTLVLDAASGDSFLKAVSGGGRGRTDISVGATWSPAQGLKLTGSSALEIAVPAHARLGPVTLETVYIMATLADDAVPIELSASLRCEIGPFTAVIDRVGALFTATFPEEGGNLGPLNLEVGFKPPSGLGLSIDGGGFSGGGFLRCDPATGEYAGALELVFQDEIQVKAFGVLDTRAEGTLSGYSLIVIVSAEFAPIQLSFGFTLTGVGGLLGVERTASIDQLKLGLRDGSIQSILFPKDLVANAPRIIADLKRLFPPQGGRYLVGPMAKIGWGSPTLVTVEIGAILELPRPGFVILGVLRLAAPPAVEDVPVLELQVNFLGVVDFLRGELSIDATLYNSRLLTFTLTGDMAARLYLWGENANLLLTVGGFHPSYTPPPMNLPTLQRLTISLFQGNPRLTAEGYFAVTANTLQFGCKIELYFGVSVFNVYGFVSLDALFQYIPPYFIAEIAGQLAVRSGGSTLFAVHLVLTLEGPTPFHARGKGSFEIGFIFTVTISASFDVTFGVERLFTPLTVSLLELIDEVLHDDGAWRAIAGPVARRGVATRELPPEAGLVVSPTGSLTVSQKTAPLGLPLARIGAARVEGANRIVIVDVSLGAGADPPSTRPVQEQFAAAQFLEMSDAEKLSRRSFEPFDSGIEIGGGGAPKADFQTKVDVAYEVVYVRRPRRRPKLFHLVDTVLDLLLGGSAAARSKRSATKRKPTGVGTPPVALPPERFRVAGVDDLALQAPGLEFTSESAAVIALADVVARNPRLKGKLQVISSHEAAA